MSAHMIIGTAGHIDHGKTALVRALTGIDLDTLPDEKKRGITIELGFAFMDAPGFDGEVVFIDVPGHEKLVKTMVAGASNIDAVLFVVAADEGISPQTVEHFDIVQLLGITNGVVALTKQDLVDESRLQAVTCEVREFSAGTFLGDAPVIPVSSVTGAGVEEVRSALVAAALKTEAREDSGVFRMPIDRVFVSKGFGAVVAGTILSGRISVGDRIEILPDSVAARVRGIQVHGKSVQSSSIGKRTAVNLQDVRKEQLRRGQCACAPGSMSPTTRIDARLHIQRNCGEEFAHRTRIRFHTGTSEVIGRAVLLEHDKLMPGETGLVQFVLESPATAARKDRFIIRTFSSMRTIGGGLVLDPHPSPHKRSDAGVADSLSRLEANTRDALLAAFAKAGAAPQTAADAAYAIGEGITAAGEVVEELAKEGALVEIGRGAAERKYIHRGSYEELSKRLLCIIRDYYAKERFRLFMPVSNLQSGFLKLAGSQVYEKIVSDLCNKGILTRRDTRIGLSGRTIELEPAESAAAKRIEDIFLKAGFATPPEEEVRGMLAVEPKLFDDIISGLVDQGRLVRLDDKIIYHADNVQAAGQVIVAHMEEHKRITVSDLRDKLGASRKYLIPLLEYFDRIQLTRREGDYRLPR